MFFGPLLQCSANSQSVLVSVSALDRGRFLVGNKGYYKFTGITPEEAAAAVCADFGIPVDRLGSHRSEADPKLSGQEPGQYHPHPVHPGGGAKRKAVRHEIHRLWGLAGGGEAREGWHGDHSDHGSGQHLEH